MTAQDVRSGLSKLMEHKMEVTNGGVQKKICIAAALLTPGASALFKKMLKKENGNPLDTIKFVDQIYDSSSQIEHLRDTFHDKDNLLSDDDDDDDDDDVDNNNDENNNTSDHQLVHLHSVLALEDGSDCDDDEVSIRSPPIESNSGPNRRS